MVWFSLTAIPVEVDHWQNTATAGGCVLYGLHATVAPRRHLQTSPVLERFDFVPYDSTACLPPHVQKYAQDVAAYAASGLQEALKRNASVSNVDQLTVLLKQMNIKTGAVSQPDFAAYTAQRDQHALIHVRLCFHLL